MIVISRAEPANLIVETLKSYFAGDTNKVAETSDEVHIPMPEQSSSGTDGPDPFISALQSVAGKFTALRMMGIGTVNLSLEIGGDGCRFYQFTTLSGKIEPLVHEVDKIDVQIRAASAEQFMHAIHTNDMSLIQVNHSFDF